MARLGSVGDRLIVMAFVELEPAELQQHQPRVVALDDLNQIVERIDYPPVALACEPEALSVFDSN
jgi:aspartate 1-decarboxylase